MLHYIVLVLGNFNQLKKKNNILVELDNGYILE